MIPVFDQWSRVPAAWQGGVVALGNFDGVHRGHQALLARAASMGAPLVALTFEPHPRRFFVPDTGPFRLTLPPAKLRLLEQYGVQATLAQSFDAAFAALTAEAFIDDVLLQGLGARHVVCGYDFTFGARRGGNVEKLREMGKARGLGVTVLDPVMREGEIYSSTRIREALRAGRVREAAELLGHAWEIEGMVEQGDQRGRTIGFPTLNIVLEKGADPFRGIYAVRVRDALQQGAPLWSGAGYFGDRPTFDTGRTFLEVYLIGFDGDLYGRQLFVEFIDLIRGDKRFASIDELVTQMKLDCDAAVTRLAAPDDAMMAFPLGRLQAEGKI